MFESSLRAIQRGFQREFKKRFRSYIKERKLSNTPFTRGIFSAVEDFVLRPAKRIRPYLLFLAANQYATDLGSRHKIGTKNYKLYNTLWNFAIGIELVHSGMLMHDDIMDNDMFRRGKPAMHRILGTSQAINVGDLTWSLGYDFMLMVDAAVHKKESTIREFLRAALLTGEGQALDLQYNEKKRISKRELYTMYELKTVHYSVIAPMVMGAQLAGRDASIPIYRKIGKNMGLLFQLQDDILDEKSEKQSFMKKVAFDVKKEKAMLYKQIQRDIKKSGHLPPGTKRILEELAHFLYDRSS